VRAVIEAAIRLRCDGGIGSRVGQVRAAIAELLDERWLAGEDFGSRRVIARSGAHLKAALERVLKVHPSISTTPLAVLQTPGRNRPRSPAGWRAGRAGERG
jgi:Lrp/AsnC family leucine-responsive transcriptional regulator